MGWIGLGRMGSRMVKHLLDAGNSVVVYDSNQVSWRSSDRLVQLLVLAGSSRPGSMHPSLTRSKGRQRQSREAVGGRQPKQRQSKDTALGRLVQPPRSLTGMVSSQAVCAADTQLAVMCC